MKIRAVLNSTLILAMALGASAQEKIVFTISGNHDDVYSMNPDGTDQRRLTSWTSHERFPSISPDGRKVVFVSNFGGDENLWVMNIEGSNQVRLTNSSPSEREPVFSPDGSLIAYACQREVGFPFEICIMNSDGTSQRYLTNTPEMDEHWPTFSPDGNKLAFAGGGDDADIFSINVDGTGKVNLTTGTGLLMDSPSYSPDGNTIAVHSLILTTGRTQIFLMNDNGSNIRQLTNIPGGAIAPRFSPDGSQIAYVTIDDPNNPNIWSIDINSHLRTQLTSTNARESQPFWGGRARRPVLIVPGIGGTYAADTSNDINWLMNRGLSPATMQPDPLSRVYHDLIKTLENVGYERDKDLFVVNYDWRLVPGPRDEEFDGVINGITASSISDEHFEYGVDYLGLTLKKAYERWEEDHDGEALEEVNVIAHSTGGLVTRTYIQSPAYNTAFSGSKKLPKVKEFMMVGVPNQGASKAWNAIHDNWNADIAYKYVLSKIVNRAYQKVLAGHTVSGPDHNIDIDAIRDENGDPNHIKFINLYVPTLRALLATYEFINFGGGYTHVNNDSAIRNDWVLDLNAGYGLSPSGDRNSFAEHCEPTVIYADGQETFSFVSQVLSGGDNVLFNFDDIIAGDVPANIPWFMEIPGIQRGDGTVSTISSTKQFEGDDRVTLRRIDFENPNHTGLMYNFGAQAVMLATLGESFEVEDISTNLAWPLGVPGAIISVVWDPVDGFVIDAKGRRLGYSDETGPVTEIPGSVWYGDADGAAWIFGEVERPLRVELVGRGEQYYVEVTVHAADADGGVVDSGYLEKGEKRSLQVAVGKASLSGRVTDARGRGIKGVFMFLTDGAGVQRTVYTNSFGYYRFFDVPAEVEYQLMASSKRNRFEPASRSIGLKDDLTDIDFVSVK